ncbi:MAG: FKBP-type peptidyl-prolyl cis-trans isomerase, partial [Spirochaetota bacterium]
MKRIQIFIISFVFLLNSKAKITTKEDLKNEKEKFSYVLGANIGRQFKDFDKEDIDMDILFQGLKAAQEGKKPIFSLQEMQKISMSYSKKLQEKSVKKMKTQIVQNKKEGEAFLLENKKKQGVKTTASGLQYTILRQGTGQKPGPTDRVKVHYRGTLLNGDVFDSSYGRGKPVVFPANRVIKGWTEALQLMPVG